MRISVPTNPLYDPLLTHAEKVCAEMKWTLERHPESVCVDRMLNNFSDIALLSPLGYGKGVGRVDYRIIQNPCIALVDYTEVAGVVFNELASEINTVGSSNPTAFLPVIGSLLMREKFEADDSGIVFAADVSSVDCLINEADLSEQRSPTRFAMDVGEEWFDLIELPLPVGLWVCRADIDTEHIRPSLTAMASEQLADRNITERVSLSPDVAPREGRISYTWTDEVEQGLDAVLRMLFYYQLLPEIPAVKLLDRD